MGHINRRREIMGGVYFILVMAALMFAISITLLAGKGSWLIAGYNTASPEEKAKYDEKKICRAMGIFCLLLTLLLCAMAYLGYRVEAGLMAEQAMLPFAIFFILVVVLAVVATMFYTNRRCRR